MLKSFLNQGLSEKWIIRFVDVSGGAKQNGRTTKDNFREIRYVCVAIMPSPPTQHHIRPSSSCIWSSPWQSPMFYFACLVIQFKKMSDSRGGNLNNKTRWYTYMKFFIYLLQTSYETKNEIHKTTNVFLFWVIPNILWVIVMKLISFYWQLMIDLILSLNCNTINFLI